MLWHHLPVAILQQQQIRGTWRPETPEEVYDGVLQLTGNEDTANAASSDFMAQILDQT